MTIAIDLTELYDNLSGIERYAMCMTLEIVKQFPEHEYILLFKNEVHPALRECSARKNVKTVVLRGRDKLFFSQFTLPRALNRLSFDLAFFFCYPAPLLMKRPEKSVSAIHDLCVYDCPGTMTAKSRVFFRTLFRRAVRKGRAIVTVSQFSKSRIEHYFPACKHIIVAESGCDHILRREDGQKPSRDFGSGYLLALSTIEPRKNLRLLLAAFSELAKDSDLRLILAGRTGWKEDGLFDGLSPEIAARVERVGFVPDGDLPALYRKAACFVFPSLYEGFGLPPLEAMAMGGIVVSSDAASMPEVLSDGAIYFRSGDREDLIGAIGRALSLPEGERERLRERGKARVSNYTWEKSGRKLMDELCRRN